MGGDTTVLKRKLCEATLTWKLSCDGPLLIADGRYEYDKLKGPNTSEEKKGQFPHKVFISHAPSAEAIEKAVRTVGKSGTLTLPFYVPGTSLRGPFRAQAERIIRSLLPDSASSPSTACDPFEMDETTLRSCSKRLESDNKPSPYAQACPACKLFGCTATASRIRFTDADIPPTQRVSVYRDMIGIDRFTGGVFQGETDEAGKKKSGGANMRLHALEQTSWTTTVTVTNFELWQLGLLAYVFRDFQDGLVPIGYGKTKGFGTVTGTVQTITLTYPTGRWDGKIAHLGSLACEAERIQYAFHTMPAATCDGLQATTTNGLSLYESITVPTLNHDQFWAAVARAFLDFIAKRRQEART
jgi:CRISPR/Cas system CSM-associated protein Csm3 (group 7 of RAMP superfamily)